MPPISFGLVLPSSSGPRVPDPRTLFHLMRAADDSPLTHLWASDHLLWWHPMYESLSLLASAAAITRRIEVGTAVLLLALRKPLVVAKALATIQELSRGRLTVGVGIGGEFPLEWEAAGVDWKTRVSRTEEMIEVLRGLWGPGAFTYRGRRVIVEEVDLTPKPEPPPPIWIGGRKEPSIRRAARLGDGWMGIFLTPDRYRQAVELLEDEAAGAGRDPQTIARSLYIWTAIGETDDAAREIAEATLGTFYNVEYEQLERFAAVGSPETCATRFQEFADAGAEHLAIAVIAAPPYEKFLETLVDAVIPLVSQ